MTTRAAIKSLFQQRTSDGWWVYLMWLAGFCALAFIATGYAAVLGQDFLSAFLFFLVLAFIGYVQIRMPTVIGWLVLFVPTALFGIVAIGLFPVSLTQDLGSGEFGRAALSTILIVTLVTVLVGFIYNMKRYLAEPGGRGNRPPAP